MRQIFYTFLIALVLTALGGLSQGYAACAKEDNTSVAQSYVAYFNSDKTLRICDGTNWQTFLTVCPSGAACTTSTGDTGICAADNMTCNPIPALGPVQCWGGMAPTPPSSLVWAKKIYPSLGFFSGLCLIADDDTVRCSGATISPSPAIKAKSMWVGIAAACAIKDDDIVQCWGSNPSNGGNPPAPPFKAKLLEGGTSSSGVCAIKDDNTVVCWGEGIMTNPNITTDTLVGTPRNMSSPLMFAPVAGGDLKRWTTSVTTSTAATPDSGQK